MKSVSVVYFWEVLGHFGGIEAIWSKNSAWRVIIIQKSLWISMCNFFDQNVLMPQNFLILPKSKLFKWSYMVLVFKSLSFKTLTIYSYGLTVEESITIKFLKGKKHSFSNLFSCYLFRLIVWVKTSLVLYSFHNYFKHPRTWNKRMAFLFLMMRIGNIRFYFSSTSLIKCLFSFLYHHNFYLSFQYNC